MKASSSFRRFSQNFLGVSFALPYKRSDGCSWCRRCLVIGGRIFWRFSGFQPSPNLCIWRLVTAFRQAHRKRLSFSQRHNPSLTSFRFGHITTTKLLAISLGGELGPNLVTSIVLVNGDGGLY